MKIKPVSFFLKLLYWIIAIWFFIFGIQAIKDYLGFGSYAKKKALCEELIANGGNAIATFLPEKSEKRSLSLAGVEVIDYKVAYEFTVDGNTYVGTYETKVLPENIKKRVFYKKSDPSKNIMDPDIVLQGMNDDEDFGALLWIGLACFIIGFLMILRGILQFIKSREGVAKNQFLSHDESKIDVAQDNSSDFERGRLGNSTEKISELTNDVGEKQIKDSTQGQAASTISKEALNAKSEKMFKETDHSRFMHPSMRRQKETNEQSEYRAHSEEE